MVGISRGLRLRAIVTDAAQKVINDAAAVADRVRGDRNQQDR
jgi:hypothetical protein